MKKYIMPAIEILDREMEQQLLTGSLLEQIGIDVEMPVNPVDAEIRQYGLDLFVE